jgi:hypothetical protein
MSNINLFLKPESTLKLNSSVNTLISAPSFQHPTLGGSLSNLSNFLDSTDFSHNGSNLILKSLSYAKMADVPSENVSTLSYIQEPVVTSGALLSNIAIGTEFKYLAFTYDTYPTINADSSNLVAWYKLDSNNLDSSKNGFHLTFRGSAGISTVNAVSPASPNKFLVLNGANNYADINSGVNIYDIYRLNPGQIGGSEIGITFSCWFKADSGSGNFSRVFEFANNTNGAPDTGLLVAKSSSATNLYFQMYNPSGSSSPTYQATSVNYFDGTWRHICWSISSTGAWSIYNNGTPFTGISITQGITNATFTAKYIGKSGFTNDGYNTNGGVQDFRIYNKGLSETEVTALYNTTQPQKQYTVNFPEPTGTLCDILVVGGGGAGADTSWVGGGGAGGLIYYKKSLSGTYQIKVGKGGGPQEDPVVDDSAPTMTTSANSVKNGKNSEILDYVGNVLFKAVGGSMGTRNGSGQTSIITVFAGGSSGGSGYPGTDFTKYKVGNLSSENIVNGIAVSISSQGGETNNNDTYNNSSFGVDSYGNQYGMFGKRGGKSVSQRAGGGGGAGSLGGDGVSGDNGVGSGGFGKDMSVIFGTNVGAAGWFAGGGGGGGKSSTVPGGLGGKGGGGYGAFNTRGEAGQANTGGGGGAADGGIGGNGGSGIVIIRYKLTTGSNTNFKPPAILKYLPNPTPPTNPKWQPIINPSSTSDFLMTLSNSSNFSNLSTKLNTNYYDLYHSNIMSLSQTDSYRIILNASIDHTSTDGNKYISSTLYYTKTPAIFFANCNLSSSQPPSEWSFVNLTDRLRIGVTTSNFIPTLKVNL